MPQQYLNETHIGAVLQHVRGAGVAKQMTGAGAGHGDARPIEIAPDQITLTALITPLITADAFLPSPPRHTLHALHLTNRSQHPRQIFTAPQFHGETHRRQVAARQRIDANHVDAFVRQRFGNIA